MIVRGPITRFLIAAALLNLAVAGAAEAKKKGSASTEPGEYKEWKGEIDVLRIVARVDLSSYSRVVVTGFDTSKTPLPDEDDNTYEPVKRVLADVSSAFVEGLAGELSIPVEKGAAAPGVLVVRGSVKEMDPGSKAARYWGGFGAGAARTALHLLVEDGASGAKLLEIEQERRSGVGMAGGDYVKLMERNLRKIGEDVALVLEAF